MALVGRRDGRNFGFGRQLSYAGRQALQDLFAGGHYATVKAHGDRWRAFVRWCRSEDGPGYNDARQIDRDTLQSYALYLRQQVQQGEVAIATAQTPVTTITHNPFWTALVCPVIADDHASTANGYSQTKATTQKPCGSTATPTE